MQPAAELDVPARQLLPVEVVLDDVGECADEEREEKSERDLELESRLARPAAERQPLEQPPPLQLTRRAIGGESIGRTGGHGQEGSDLPR